MFTDGMEYWAKEAEVEDAKITPWMWWRRTKTHTLEATAYGILSYVADPDTNTDQAIGCLRYLTSKTNARGGFTSTQVRLKNNKMGFFKINIGFFNIVQICSINYYNNMWMEILYFKL